MTTNGRVVGTLDNMPSSRTTTRNSIATMGVIYDHSEPGGKADKDSPSASPLDSPTPPVLHRSFSTQLNELSSRNRSPSGDSTTSVGSGTRTSPLTNIMFLEEFSKEEIGQGFFASVYKVQHRFTYQVFAAKINTRENNWDNVQHEIQLMARITHPNVIRLKGLVIHEGYLHPLLEFINGGTLTSLLLDNQVYLAWPVRIGLASDIAGAMAYLHKKGIMHRDLTSLNILIKRVGLDMRAVVCDLGLSCRFPRELSGLKSPVGTPFWMAPECLCFKPYDEKSDVFSFGVVLCEIIARVTADPDELPRLKDFGLDEEAFKAISGACPEPLLDLANMCCKMTPFSRPAFVDVEFHLQHIRIKLSRAGRNKTQRDNPERSRRHSAYLNVPEATIVQSIHQQQHSQLRKPLLTRSNSDRRTRDRRLSSRQQQLSNNANPFDTPALKGGKTKFVNSQSTSREQLKQLSPEMTINIREVLSTLFAREDVMHVIDPPTKRRLSVSLPSSPELHRREISLEDEDDFLDDLASWPSSSDTYEQCNGRRTSPTPPDDRIPSPSFYARDVAEATGDCIASPSRDTTGNGIAAHFLPYDTNDTFDNLNASAASDTANGRIASPCSDISDDLMASNNNTQGKTSKTVHDGCGGDVRGISRRFEQVKINVEDHGS